MEDKQEKGAANETQRQQDAGNAQAPASGAGDTAHKPMGDRTDSDAMHRISQDESSDNGFNRS